VTPSCADTVWVKDSCARCGGISSELFWRLSADGAKVIKTDKPWKYYIETDNKMLKFYTWHL
jgi:hypothetical protein